jgi:hypothetical protein
MPHKKFVLKKKQKIKYEFDMPERKPVKSMIPITNCIEINFDLCELLYNSLYLCNKYRKTLFKDDYCHYSKSQSALSTADMAISSEPQMEVGIKGKDIDNHSHTKWSLHTNIIDHMIIMKGSMSFDLSYILEKSTISFDELLMILPFVDSLTIKISKIRLSNIIEYSNGVSKHKTCVISKELSHIEKQKYKVKGIIPLPHMWNEDSDRKYKDGYIFVIDVDDELDIEKCEIGHGIFSSDSIKYCETSYGIRGHYIEIGELGNVNNSFNLKVKMNGITYNLKIE